MLALAMVQLWKKPFEKAKALEFEKKKKVLRDTLTRAALCGLVYNGKLANQTARLVAIVVKSQLIRFIYLLRSFSHPHQAKTELVSAHNKNGIIE